MDEKDAQLLARYREGDIPALEELVGRYQRPLFGYILQVTSRRDDPDDVFQEVWIRVIRHAGSYRPGNFLGWLVRIAHNLVVDRARRRKPDLSLDQEDEFGRTLESTTPSSDRGALRQVVADNLGRRIEQALAVLPAEQKEVFVMRTQAQLSFKEIARIQRVSINTALARMQYALKKLRKVLRSDYEGLDGRA
jgi:RNA polymerase sigma-70 factor, ECF subfamily